uniref:Uncharacterized protein n=1 Tax=Rhizophora mucronata TaxID=61149 RepID=A0A2P2QEX3_RHIMU
MILKDSILGFFQAKTTKDTDVLSHTGMSFSI